MGLFKKLFSSKTSLELVDVNLGKFNSNYIKGSEVNWIGTIILFEETIELIIDGNSERLSPNQKKIILNALSNEEILKSESSVAINEEYNNADMEFQSLDEQFQVKAITSNENGFELSFEQKENPYYYFNVFFENNKQRGVSIDS
ncbi:hypothetical protein [uncultured Aquimarina sp.]|uniref:hypothetical protein n=1 Tax=uncultured Aquimarina sp. TaxID=575652 RepID=UPI00262476DE|nr:hypothetical protein [uncultured Aquimarina sp.]